MRCFLGLGISRELERTFLNIVGDFVGGRLDQCGVIDKNAWVFWRLRIFVTKRRQLGQVYVEMRYGTYEGTLKKPCWRQYLSSFWWDPQRTPLLRNNIKRLYAIKHSMFDEVSTVHLDKQIQVCLKSVENHTLHPYRR